MLRNCLRGLGMPALVLGAWLLSAAPASAGILGWAIAARALSNFGGFGGGPYGYYDPYWGPYDTPYYGYGYSPSPWNYGPGPRAWDSAYPNAPYAAPMNRDAYTSFYPPQNAVQNTALIDVRVPPNAELWFGNDRTSQTGQLREFETPELKQGKEYSYTLKARWSQNGEQTEKTRQVRVRPGSRVMVDFFRAP